VRLEPLLATAGTATLFAVVLLAGHGAVAHRPGRVRALVVLGALTAAAVALALLPLASGWPSLAVMAVAALTGLLLPVVRPFAADQIAEVGALVLLGSAGAAALVQSSNLVTLAVGLETLSLATAVLTGLSRGERAVEAAFKYFVLASMSIATIVFGLGLHALATGSLELGAQPLPEPWSVQLHGAALVLLALGFAFELAVVPFQYALLGTYTSAAPALAGFMMAAAKLGAALTLVRVVAAAPDLLRPLLTVLGVLSAVWGTVGAFAQRDLRGLLGYSAISHGGFVALALAAGPEGRHAVVLYVLVYAATAMLTFGALADRGEDRLPLARPLAAAPSRGQNLALALGLASFAGMPPTPGFWAKLAVLGVAAAHCGALATAVAATSAVLGAIYYLRPVPDLLAGSGAGRTENGTRLALLGAAAALAFLTAAPYVAERLAP
jgi:NADH-quinone oxidoreductase subunit N